MTYLHKLLLGTVFVFAISSLRANTVDAQFVSGGSTIDFGYYVGPYSGTLDGQSVVLDCVDFANEVTFGQQWTANLSHINTLADLANTRYGGVANSLQLYQEAAWLTEQYSLNPTSAYGDIQTTIWRFSTRMRQTRRRVIG